MEENRCFLDFDNKYGLGETMTMGELNDFIKLQKLRGSDEIKYYIIEKYIRYAQPFTVIILVILGVIIASRKSRQGTWSHICQGNTLIVFNLFFIDHQDNLSSFIFIFCSNL